VIGTDGEKKILEERMHADVEWPASGCCGLAGSWGFEKDKYDISMQCGERVLFPAVRDAAPDTVIVADGFSCRTQIQQGTKRRAVHLAQLIKAELERAQAAPGEHRVIALPDIATTAAAGRSDAVDVSNGTHQRAKTWAAVGAASVAAATAARAVRRRNLHDNGGRR